jgi:hypothetical protein
MYIYIYKSTKTDLNLGYMLSDNFIGVNQGARHRCSLSLAPLNTHTYIYIYGWSTVGTGWRDNLWNTCGAWGVY